MDFKKIHIKKAKEYYKSGYNCSQAVCAAFADYYHIDQETAFRISASFGGGIGQLGETCGAACGMFILAGLDTAKITPENKKDKLENYQLVRDLAEKFAQKNGALKCKELKALKRPCLATVEEAATIWCDYLDDKKKI